MGLKLTHNEFRDNVGAQYGRCCDDDGNVVGETWASDEKEIAAWFETMKAASEKVTEGETAEVTTTTEEGEGERTEEHHDKPHRRRR